MSHGHIVQLVGLGDLVNKDFKAFGELMSLDCVNLRRKTPCDFSAGHTRYTRANPTSARPTNWLKRVAPR